jgi:5-methylcytosine-specific restriction endonuclease McrA
MFLAHIMSLQNQIRRENGKMAGKSVFVIFTRKNINNRNRRKIMSIEKKCKKCGKIFETSEKRPNTFCSTKCSNSYKKRRVIWIKIKCKECGKIFEVPPALAKTQKFCSRKCIYENKEMLEIMKAGFLKGNEKNNQNRALKTKQFGDQPLFDDFKERLDWIEEIRCKPNTNILQIKCKYCGKWIIPSKQQLQARCTAIRLNRGHGYIYCSEGCKLACPVFQQHKWFKNFSPGGTSREVQPELRQLVLERDNYTCQKCGSVTELHCHHIEGIYQNPIESADIDNCITFCKECHIEVHSQKGCTYNDMKKCGYKYGKGGMLKNDYRYIFIAPDGVEYKVKWLKSWCKEMNFHYYAFLKLASNKITDWNGWSCNESWLLNRKLSKIKNSRMVKSLWCLVSPEGKIFEDTNIKQLCKKLDLPLSSVYVLSRKQGCDMGKLKGWKIKRIAPQNELKCPVVKVFE